MGQNLSIEFCLCIAQVSSVAHGHTWYVCALDFSLHYKLKAFHGLAYTVVTSLNE